MAEKKDLYGILGVARDADRDTIRKAYRKLARQSHADLNPGDKAAEARFKEISKAWEVLEDTEKCRNYDDFGEVSLEKSFDAEKARMAREAFGVRPGAGGFAEEFHFGGINDVLGGLFGHAAEGKGIRLRGTDLKAELELEFPEAIRGGEKRLTLARPTLEGGVASETLTVRIPPGVDGSERLRVPGKGAPGVGGGLPGDLWVAPPGLDGSAQRQENLSTVGRTALPSWDAGARSAITGAEGGTWYQGGRAGESGRRTRVRASL
jgi:DnaJ-class molecular chaperone